MRVADAWSTDGVPKVVFTDYYRISEIVRLSDCFASLAMTCNGLFMSLRGAQRRSNLYTGQSQNLRNAVLHSESAASAGRKKPVILGEDLARKFAGRFDA